MREAIKYLSLASLISRCTGTARICPELIFIVPAVQSWMPSVKLLYPLRVVVEPACLTCWSTHPPWVPQRGVHHFTRSKSTMLIPSLQRGGPYPRTCYLQVDWLEPFYWLKATWLELSHYVVNRSSIHRATSWAAHDCCCQEAFVFTMK